MCVCLLIVCLSSLALQACVSWIGNETIVVPDIRHTVKGEDLAVDVVQDCVSRMMVSGDAGNHVTPLRRFLHVRLVVLLDGALPSARNSPITRMRGSRNQENHKRTIRKRMQIYRRRDFERISLCSSVYSFRSDSDRGSSMMISRVCKLEMYTKVHVHTIHVLRN